MQGKKVILRRKRLEDAERDYAWRKDPELARLDAAPPLTMSYQDYLAIYRDEYLASEASEICLNGRRRIRLAIDTLDGQHIGNITLYDIDQGRKQAELGIMIGDKRYWGMGYGTDAILTLLEWVFTETDLERIYLHTLDWNARARRCFEKCGFRQCRLTHEGRHQFVEMELWRRDFPSRSRAGRRQEGKAAGT